MKFQTLALVISAVALLAGCASGGKSMAEQAPGKFVTYSCEGNKSFQVRFDAESGTARIRTHEGSAELAKGSRGLYRDDGGEWMLTLSDASDTELWHKGSTKYKQCAAK
ncbi:MAG: hypothetical protein FD187_200 [bacterium]|nr:MAG: hypothetical protein FD142_1417 [bacterium]KAF0150768.1 MAG: hypothetical protein FD187_200 [bacterium]KAF0165496.1 MAG: hypothetical protein FD158_2883 [bacterium]TXT18437.1 MAG: hypothetical protein FD132_2096 [bacterium]